MKTLPVKSTYEKIALKYTQEFFNDLSDSNWVDKVLRNLKAGDKILDAGCGPGTYAKYSNERGFDTIGIDISPKMLSIAKRKLPNGKFLNMSLQNLKFPENTFNAILCLYSLIHIPDNDVHSVLENFHKVLKQKGYLLVIAQKGKSDQIVDEPLMKGEKIFINFFDKARLNNHLNKSGFEIIEQLEKNNPAMDGLSNRVIYSLSQCIK